MKEFPTISKSEDEEVPVPNEWRQTFIEIVEAFRDGNFKIGQSILGVKPLSDKEAQRIADNIVAYGNNLDSLSEDSWKTSVCRWVGEYWEVLVDLFTVQEGLSDLVLFARVYQRNCSYEFEIDSVNVP